MSGIYFEQLYKASDCMEEAFNEERRKYGRAIDNDDLKQAMYHHYKANGIFCAIVLFYQTALQHGKFKAQRHHCRAAITRMDPAFAEGYFKGKK